MNPAVYFRPMSGIEQHVDWTAAPGPAVLARKERVGPGLAARGEQQAATGSRRDVMQTLLGKNNLAALDASGGDPYNATGRHFRR